MTEDEAHAWIREHFGVSRETSLGSFEALLREEAAHQNLVSAASLEEFWVRHVVDSAQLVPLAGQARAGHWVDIGSGAGLPGIIVALLSERSVTLVEPRARRVAFLQRAVGALGLAQQVTVFQGKIETFKPSAPAAVISARAVAVLEGLFIAAAHCAAPSTLWLLPKGRNAQIEVDAARHAWQAEFHVEHSITQPDSGIVIARGVRRK